MVAVLGMSCLLLAGGISQGAEKVTLIYWTHWGQNPKFNEWYVEKGKEFAKLHPEVAGVEVVNIPYEGYEAKYLSAFVGKTNAPDFFNGMAHQWAGKYQFADPMPQDLVEKLDPHIPAHMKKVGVWDGVRYGVPIEGANFQMLYINADMFEEAGLDPNRPPQTLDELLEYAKKLTKYDSNGEIVRAGIGIRYKGHPLGIADKFLPFLHAYGGRMLSPDNQKASGYVNSEAAIAALQYYGDLVNKHKVASLKIENPAGAFGQKLAAMIYRESWYVGWLANNAPDVKFKVHPLPKQVEEPGAGNLFPWCDMVYAFSPKKKWVWEFFRFISTAQDDLEHHKAQGIVPMWKENFDSDYVKQRPDYEAIKAMLAQRVPPNYYIPAAHELAYALGDAVLEVLYNKKTPKQALDDAAQRMDQILAEQ